ncbi:Deoxyribonuclease-1 [Halocaridina rubra]|uniref:Deoxyribonuclease-1 n=1 Tax=Halocaridina rubra TaxID=373956 RepID=A0AAN8WKD2_HALRR
MELKAYFWTVALLTMGVNTHGTTVEAPLRVGAWNLQRLGPTKMSKPAVVQVFVQVMRRFDIIVLLEVTDASGEAPVQLLDALNEGLTDTYNLTISARLGRTSYKEQYAFYWKSSRVTAVSTFQYNDDANDVFQFEPFIVVFEGSVDSRVSRFGLVPIHTKPTDAVAEVDGLVDVYDSFRTFTSIEDVIILGDYNAGCDYVGGADYDNIRLYTDPRFTWMISDHVDTTTKGTTCPYDRIVVAGSNMVAISYKYTAGPYYYDEALGITDDDLITDVSDHYPVEMLLRGSVVPGTESVVAPNTCISVSLGASASEITALAQSLSPNQEVCSIQDLMLVTWTVNSTSTAITSLRSLSSSAPDVVPIQAVDVLEYKISQGGLQDITLHAEGGTTSSYTVSLLCQKSQGSCTLSLSTPTSIN